MTRLFISTSRCAALAAALAIAACGGKSHGDANPDAGAGTGTGTGTGSDGPITPISIAPPTAIAAPVDDNPTAPTAGGAALGWADAPIITGVQYVPDRDSVELVLPAVTGAVDYRAILLTAQTGVSESGGAETVTGTTIVCAGYLQRNTHTQNRELLDTIQVTGLSGATHIVLEAIDQPCPFTGVMAPAHADVDRTSKTNPEILAVDSRSYSAFTEDEVTKAYGAVIMNGQGPSANYGDPATPAAPTVLGRTTVMVAPTGTTAAPPTKDFFEDFSTPDQPVKTVDGVTCYPSLGCDHPYIDYFENKRWIFEANMDVDQYFIDRGGLHAVVADRGADAFGTAIAYPKQLAQMSDTGYLHVTYEVNALTTARRYPWLSVCGADTAGQTIKADGTPAFHIDADSSLQLGDGNNPNASGFNCVMLFSKDGNLDFALPVGDGTMAPPETDMRVLVYKTGTGVTGLNVSPDIYDNGWMPHSWFRMLGAGGAITGPMIDMQNLNHLMSRFDVFVRRGRVVVYVNGQQKLCNDFDPKLVTMAEAMVGFGQVLYHTSAEHNEMTPNSQDLNGMWERDHHTYENLKYFDRRDWDNLGFENNVALPTDGPSAFDESICYKSALE